jgi:hypothetical protein
MVAAKKKYIRYHCVNYRKHGKAGCPTSKSYSEHLILPPIIDFLAGFIQDQLDFRDALDNAAAQYGKSITEEAIEAAVQGELASVQAGKERLIEAISLGILTNEEAATKLAELREQEQRLTIELSSIAEKTAIMGQWQDALEALRGKDISDTLQKLAEQKPITFRRFLSIVFEPNSLKIRTEGKGRKWFSVLEDYQLTEAMENLSVPFSNNPLKLV